MIVDALVAADPALRISEQIHDPSDFQRLDDGLIDVRSAEPCRAWGGLRGWGAGGLMLHTPAILHSLLDAGVSQDYLCSQPAIQPASRD